MLKYLILGGLPVIGFVVYWLIARTAKNEIRLSIAKKNILDLQKIFNAQQIRKRQREKTIQKIAHGVSDDDAGLMLSDPPKHPKLSRANGTKSRKD